MIVKSNPKNSLLKECRCNRAWKNSAGLRSGALQTFTQKYLRECFEENIGMCWYVFWKNRMGNRTLGIVGITRLSHTPCRYLSITCMMPSVITTGSVAVYNGHIHVIKTSNAMWTVNGILAIQLCFALKASLAILLRFKTLGHKHGLRISFLFYIHIIMCLRSDFHPPNGQHSSLSKF